MMEVSGKLQAVLECTDGGRSSLALFRLSLPFKFSG